MARLRIAERAASLRPTPRTLDRGVGSAAEPLVRDGKADSGSPTLERVTRWHDRAARHLVSAPLGEHHPSHGRAHRLTSSAARRSADFIARPWPRCPSSDSSETPCPASPSWLASRLLLAPLRTPTRR